MALFALALVGAGCGSDDSDSGGGEEGEISSIVEESVVFEDAATVCEENFTDNALEENFDGKDRDAQIEDCSDDEPSDIADLEVSDVKITGDSATAEVTGTEEDEELDITVELVKDGGDWKIDGVK